MFVVGEWMSQRAHDKNDSFFHLQCKRKPKPKNVVSTLMRMGDWDVWLAQTKKRKWRERRATKRSSRFIIILVHKYLFKQEFIIVVVIFESAKNYLQHFVLYSKEWTKKRANERANRGLCWNFCMILVKRYGVLCKFTLCHQITARQMLNRKQTPCLLKRIYRRA